MAAGAVQVFTKYRNHLREFYGAAPQPHSPSGEPIELPSPVVEKGDERSRCYLCGNKLEAGDLASRLCRACRP